MNTSGTDDVTADAARLPKTHASNACLFDFAKPRPKRLES